MQRTERIAKILELLGTYPEGATSAELAKDLGLPLTLVSKDLGDLYQPMRYIGQRRSRFPHPDRIPPPALVDREQRGDHNTYTYWIKTPAVAHVPRGRPEVAHEHT